MCFATEMHSAKTIQKRIGSFDMFTKYIGFCAGNTKFINAMLPITI